MRFFKLGIISFIIFFILLFLMSLLIPSHVRISRAINITGAKSVIHPYLSDTNNWKQWNEMSVSNIQINLEKNTIDHITSNWRYDGRDIKSSFRLEESAGVTVVQWYFDFALKWYPWEKFGSITFDKQFGTPMEKSLNNLKSLIENSP